MQLKANYLLTILILLNLGCGLQKNKVSSFAGSGVMSYKNGTLLEANFANPMGITIDEDGNVYVADAHNNLIRKISTDGQVSTLAGSRQEGKKDGPSSQASFFYPTALVAAPNGIIYVADTRNNLIRKISKTGEVTTLRTNLLFDSPHGMAIDHDNNIYITDWHDQIRKISQDGSITLFAGSGEKGAFNADRLSASFYLPQGMVFDKNNNLFICDTYNNQIRKIDSAGMVTTYAGKKKKGEKNGSLEEAMFYHPTGIAIDTAGNLYIADTGNNLIRKINTRGNVSTLAGSGKRGFDNGSLQQASFWSPIGLVIDQHNNLYISDNENNCIRKIELQ